MWLIIIFLYSILCYFCGRNKVSNLYAYFYIFIFVFFAAFRNIKGGGGSDIYLYSLVFESDNYFSYNSFEPLFLYFYSFLRLFDDNYYFMIAVSSILFITGKFLVIKKYSQYFYIAAFLFVSKFYLKEFIYLRQSMAMLILWVFAVPAILNKKLFIFLVVTICAYFIHNSAIIFILSYFIINFRWDNKKVIFLYILILICILTPLLKYLFLSLNYFVDNKKLASYISISGGLKINYILETFLLLFVYLNAVKVPEIYNDNIMYKMTNGLLAYIFITLLGSYNGDFIRFSWYFLIFYVVSISNYIINSKNKFVLKMFFFVYSVLLYVKYFINFDDGDFLNYSFTIFH